MSLLLASTLAASVVAAADLDLQSPTVFVSPAARAVAASGSAAQLVCIDLSKRSGKFSSACVTGAEWQKAVELAQSGDGRKAPVGGVHGLIPQPFQSQLTPPSQTGGLRK